MTRIPAVLTVLLALSVASATAATPPNPRTVPGWPRTADAGRVLQGPSGGVVVVSQDGSAWTVRAFRRDGRPLWANRRRASCGNCDDGPQPEALQPDGTYGPIGPEGDDTWAVGPRGRTVRGCAGIVGGDGSCIAGGRRIDPVTFESSPAVSLRSPTAAWTVSDAAWLWQDDFDVPPITVRDRTGVVYAAFALPVDRATRSTAPGLLVAVDPVAATILWTRVGPSQVLTALGAGVLVAEGAGITAIGPGGATLWSRPLAAGQRVAPADVAFDALRSRIYIGRSGGVPGVTALRAANGSQVWRTRLVDRARLLSVGRGGRVYIAVDRAGRPAVRGLRLRDGATVWQRRTRARALSAAELVNGTVALSIGERFGRSSQDRLTLIDPR